MAGTGFPLWNIGTVNGIDFEYEIHWLEEDLAQIAVDGDVYTNFCSVRSGGFDSLDDVLSQAHDVVIEIETEWEGDAEW